MWAPMVGITEPPVTGLVYSAMIPSYGEPSLAFARPSRASYVGSQG